MPVYPGVTDFVMLYVWNGFLPTVARTGATSVVAVGAVGTSVAPAQAAVVQDGEVASVYGPAPVDHGIITELVRKQM